MLNEKQGQKLAPVIALVGADGSGKSTVSEAVLALCQRFGPSESIHLGTKSGALGRRIRALPLIGPVFFKKITKNATDVRSKDKKIPGLATAIVVYVFSALRVRRFKKALALRERGVILVADRYPQTDVPGFFDGPGLSAAKAEGALVSWLAKKERAQFDWMVGHAPTLVIRLHVDLETAFARKPDHRYESLKAKIEAVPKLTYGDAPIVELSSLDPLDHVIAEASAAVRAALVGKGYSEKAD
jgi:thymidylate kinase